MENIYPLFEQNRILKKEYLWALRDYSFGYIQLEYQEYVDGIVRGCQVDVVGRNLVVKPGILKYQGSLYLLTEAQEIPYEAAERLEVLKVKLLKDLRSKDQISYQIHLYLDENLDKEENEFEICRFELRKGAELRTQYTDLWDMRTAYDTVNPIYATWGAIGQESLSPVVTRYYAEQIIKCTGSDAVDLAFAWTCLNTTGAAPRGVIASYVCRQMGKSYVEPHDNYQLYAALVEILCKIQRTQEVKDEVGSVRRKIVVD